MSVSAIRRLILTGLLVAIGIALSFANPTFLSLDNLMTLLQDASLTGIVAIGFTLILITAGIDMSIGAVIAITSMICVNFISYTQLPAYVYIPVALAFGCAIGWVNGFFITHFKLPEFIVTLATRGILAGLALIVAVKDDQGFVKNVFIEDELFLSLGETIGPVYIVTIVFVLLAAATQFFLKRTRAGTNVYATGANPTAARLSGINTDRTLIGVYMFSGFCAALASIFLAARMMTAMPEFGIGSEMDVIASVVIGGTPFTGGIGDIWGTVIGTLFLALVKNGILKLGLSPYIQPIVIGGIIIVVVVVDVWYKAFAEKKAAQAARRKAMQGKEAGA
ncbi:ABC transporter permease [Propionivibrio soli]|uniref:ABC transporter permease n=1 Tax=Propionivibrio soli TaxID=2976531 RepID=UPI0021E700F5